MSEQQVEQNGGGAGAGAGGSGATVAPPWLPGADAETMTYVQQKGWKEPADVLNSYRNGEKLWGAVQAGTTVALPGETADQKTRDAFYNKLGRPETADKYSVKGADFSGVPETDAAALVSLAHAEGLTDKQLKAIQKWNNETGTAFSAKLESDALVEVGQQQAALKAEWGAAHDQNLQTAKEAATKLGWTKEQINAMQLGLGFDGVMKLAHQIGTQVGEGKFVQGEGGRSAGGGAGVMTPAQAKSELTRLVSDPVFMKEWTDKAHPNHAAAIAKKSQLSAWSVAT